MSWLYQHVLRPILFAQDSETIHDRTLAALKWVASSQVSLRLAGSIWETPELPVTVAGMSFPNPVGLAAGMDKRAVAVPVWAALGFGFSELGGVTRYPQSGNPLPRMFRIPSDEALINRMGFNNGGATALAESLADWRRRGLWPRHPVGINLGKSKITPNSEAVFDYCESFRRLWILADFFVVNVSSPNTPNLRELQDKQALAEILRALQDINGELAALHKLPGRPIFVKVAPDLTPNALDQIVELAVPYKLAGFVATNTTLARPESGHPVGRLIYRETGGLSGAPLRSRSTGVIRHLYRGTSGRLPIIGVGGIFSASDAWEKITAGASLVQIYSGLVYRGPGLVREIVEGLRERAGSTPWKNWVGSRAWIDEGA